MKNEKHRKYMKSDYSFEQKEKKINRLDQISRYFDQEIEVRRHTLPTSRKNE